MTTPARTTPRSGSAHRQGRFTADPAPLRLSPEKIEEMRAEVRRRLARKRRSRPRMIVPHPPPRYDEVFADGVAWLNGKDGPLP